VFKLFILINVFTFETALWYACQIRMAIAAALLFLIRSAVAKCIPLDILIVNGISLIYIMSTSSVTFLCHVSIPAGRYSVSVTMRIDFLCVVFPYSDLMFVQKCLQHAKCPLFLLGNWG